jgi:hypothetical protein
MRPISSFVHGIIDYAAAVMLPVLPRQMGWGRCATNVIDISALMTAASSLMTKYELGVVRVIPFDWHLKLDAMQGGLFLSAATLLDEEHDDVRQCLAAYGAFCIATSLLTKPHSAVEIRNGSVSTKQQPQFDRGHHVRPGAVQTNAPRHVAAAEHI